MKALVIVLIIISFLQTTIIPIDLVLLILICRAYIKPCKENLYLAFAFGIFIAYLDLSLLGLTSIIYLIIVLLTQALARRPLSGSPLLIVPISVVFILFSQIIGMYFFRQVFDVFKILISSLLSLPIFYFVKLWEERFIIRKEIKLKI